MIESQDLAADEALQRRWAQGDLALEGMKKIGRRGGRAVRRSAVKAIGRVPAERRWRSSRAGYEGRRAAFRQSPTPDCPDDERPAAAPLPATAHDPC